MRVTTNLPMGRNYSLAHRPAAQEIAADVKPVEVFKATEDGDFVQTKKVLFRKAQGFVKTGRQELAFVSPDGKKFTVMKKDGSVQFEHRVPEERLSEFWHVPEQNVYYLRSHETIEALDATTGEVKGSHAFDGKDLYYERTVVAENGNLLVSRHEGVVELTPEMKVRKIHKVPFDSGISAAKLEKMDQGHVLVRGDFDYELGILWRDQVVLLSKDDGRDSVTVDDHGRLWTAEGRIREERGGAKAVCFDPATGNINSFRTTKEMGAIIPLHDGRLLVHEDELADPRIRVYGPDGELLKKIHLGKGERYLRDFHLRHDQSAAYAITDHYPDDGPTRRELHRIDLEPESGVGGFLGRLSTSVGLGETAEVVYETRDESFIPLILDDGRMVMFKEESIDLLSPEGKIQNTVSNLRQLEPEIAGAQSAIRGLEFDLDGATSTVDETLGGGLRDYLEGANRRFGYETAAEPAKEVGLEGWTLSEADSSLQLSTRVKADEALAAMGLDDNQDYQELIKSGTLFQTEFYERMTTFPGLPGSKVAIGTDKATVYIANFEEVDERTAHAERGDYFTNAMPLNVGGKPHLVTGSKKGKLTWHDFSGERTQATAQPRVPTRPRWHPVLLWMAWALPAAPTSQPPGCAHPPPNAARPTPLPRRPGTQTRQRTAQKTWRSDPPAAPPQSHRPPRVRRWPTVGATQPQQPARRAPVEPPWSGPRSEPHS